MPIERLEPGSFVPAVCTRCKAALRHTVVALVDGVPKRVRCNTCGGEHVYHAPPSDDQSEERPAAKPRPARAPKAGTAEAAWTEQLAAASKGSGRRYAATEFFKPGQVMDHPAFGPGIVQRLAGPGKILVLFRDGARTLVCGRPA